jgi:hypothetical protein
MIAFGMAFIVAMAFLALVIVLGAKALKGVGK